MVLNTVRNFEKQIDAPDFEVVVSIDGSTDGTREALEALDLPFPLTVDYHDNQGASASRNIGASIATGEVVVFMDDDMEPAPSFLAGHWSTHQAGADVVLGPMPLHPDSPDGLLSKGVGIWAEQFEKRASAPGYTFSFVDVFGGHISVDRESFIRIGGYDTELRACEDHEFGYRCIEAGLDIRFSSQARAFQLYAVDAASHLRWHEVYGRSDVDFVRKHPDAAETLFARHDDMRTHRLAKAPTLRFPKMMGALAGPLGKLTGDRLDAGKEDPITTRLFFLTKSILYWRGVADAGGMP